MICPKCRNEVNEKWCKYCGTQIEIDPQYDLNPYDTPDKQKNYSLYEDREYYPDNQSFENKDSYRSDSYRHRNTGNRHNNNGALIAVSAFAVVLLIALVSLIAVNLTKSNDSSADIETDETIVHTDELFAKGKKYMDVGDYESAEDMFNQILDVTDDKEATILYKILFNYNRAAEETEKHDYDAAEKYFDKIPIEYTDYPISDDVDSLDDDIVHGQTAYEIFESIEDFMAEEDYEAAKESIGILNSSLLSKEDEEKIEDYIDEINRNIKDDRKEESSGTNLNVHTAESLIMEYCDSYVKAINNKDFGIVEPYIHPSSEIYDQTKKEIEQYISKGSTQKFEALELIKLTQTNSTTWTASISETKTTYHADGRNETHQFGWIYTIEYIDSDFYITKIR